MTQDVFDPAGPFDYLADMTKCECNDLDTKNSPLEEIKLAPIGMMAPDTCCPPPSIDDDAPC